MEGDGGAEEEEEEDEEEEEEEEKEEEEEEGRKRKEVLLKGLSKRRVHRDSKVVEAVYSYINLRLGTAIEREASHSRL